MKYYVCSVGEPNKSYADENMRRCIVESGFFVHPDCKQQGNLNDITCGDVLILKYDHHFFAYGRAMGPVEKLDREHWGLKVPVNGWITGKNVYKYGIQNAQLEGNNYATVRPVEEQFATDKI